MKAFIKELREADKAPGTDKIYVPGELEAERAQYNRVHGIKMGRGAFTELCEACEQYGIKDDPYQYIMED